MRISLAVAALAMAGVGAMKTYGAYTAANMSDSDLLLAENVEALSDCESINGKKNNGHCTHDDHLRYFCESPGFFDSVDCYQ